MFLVDVRKITPGTPLGETVYGSNAQPLLQSGVALSAKYLADLTNLGIRAVYIRDPDTSDLEVPQAVTPESRAKAVSHLTGAFDLAGTACGGLLHAPADTIHDQLQSESFRDSLRSNCRPAIAALSADMDHFLEQLLNRETLLGLNSIKAHDAYTFQHSIDVTIMGIVLGKARGWDRHRLKAFAMGCILHDVGKIFVDPRILNNPGRPTPAEFARVKAHPTLGYELIKAMAPSLGALVPQVAYQHHEKQDGTGYPRGLHGEKTLGVNHADRIHEFGALAAVADIYDAMSSDRPYRQAIPTDRVMKMIRSMSGVHLNRMAVDIFAKTVAPYPMCTRVRVLTGRHIGCEGIVSRIYRQSLDRPVVRLLFNPAGERLTPVELDLRVLADVNIESVQTPIPKGQAISASAIFKRTA